MKAEKVVRERLSTHAGTTALVASRIYPVVLPQEPTYPAITFSRVSSQRIEGVHTNPGMATVRIQITCWASTFDSAKSVAEQVRLALERYGTSVSGTTIAGVTVYDIHMGSEADAYEPTLDAFASSVDFTVVHAE